MNTIKKFIHYYGPYKTVFFIDLICAAVISLIDLAYPQILRTCTNTLFTKSSSSIHSGSVKDSSCTACDRRRTLSYVCAPMSLQILCNLPGTHDGSKYGTGYAAGII